VADVPPPAPPAGAAAPPAGVAVAELPKIALMIFPKMLIACSQSTLRLREGWMRSSGYPAARKT